MNVTDMLEAVRLMPQISRVAYEVMWPLTKTRIKEGKELNESIQL